MNGMIKLLLNYMGLFVAMAVFMGCAQAQKAPWENDLKRDLNQMADSLTQHLKPWDVPDRVFEVADFGAVGDGLTMNTAAIQKAIDSCSEAGGGVVLFSNGDYVTGTIELKSGVMLEVAENARLLGSTELKDYPEKIEAFKSVMSVYYEFRTSLIYAERSNNVGIRGKGEIYFRGEKKHFSSPQTIGKIVGRPLGIRMVECNNVVLQDITLRNSASWMTNFVYCNDLIFDGIIIENHANFNNDGIDPDGCTNLIVRNCFLNTEDDAMCLKGGSGKPTRNVLIENSTFISTCNAFKIGTDTQGDFENILVRNVTLGGIPDSLVTISGNQASTGITLATVDGGNVKNVYMHDITINQARCPIFIRIGNRMRLLPEWDNNGAGSLHKVLIENVDGERNFRQGSFISGIKDKPVEDVVIRNVSLSMDGISEPVFAGLPVDENEGGYPDAHQFSVNGLPSYGFYIRHANRVVLDNVEVKSIPDEARPRFIGAGSVNEVVVNGAPVEMQQLIDISFEPQLLKNVSVLGHDKVQANVMDYRVGNRAYSNRGNVIMKVEDFLQGGEYIQWPMDLRTSVADSLLTFEVTEPGIIYVAHSNVYTPQDWLANGFEKMDEDNFRMDHWRFNLYKKVVDAPGSFVLGGNHKGELPSNIGENYIVIFVKSKQ
jgi:hypothetical protein